jgi:type II secretory pathway component PulC
MKHPFWIVNLGLLATLFLSLVFVYFFTIKIVKRESIESIAAPVRKELKVAVNIQKIYENDLFGTYVKEAPKKQTIDAVIPFPAPPVQQQSIAPKIVEPEFLDPLQVTLMGIIVVGSNDMKNRAIIQEDKTKLEATYKVGDIIQDAQLIRIFKNKIVFLRLNGQQEVLYLREQDAKIDAINMQPNRWDDVVKKVDAFNYLINPVEFVKQVESLTQCIEMLNSTTAYQKGKSVGLRIGQSSSEQSLATALGMQKGDIVTAINNIPTQTIDERLAIYKNIIHLPIGYSIKVDLVRKNRPMALYYTLHTLEEEPVEQQLDATKEVQELGFFGHKHSTQSEQQHYAFMPTVNKLRKKDYQMMLQNGNS